LSHRHGTLCRQGFRWIVIAKRAGVIESVDSSRIVVRVTEDAEAWIFTVLLNSSAPTRNMYEPEADGQSGDTVEKGAILADGPSTNSVNWP